MVLTKTWYNLPEYLCKDLFIYFKIYISSFKMNPFLESVP